MECFCYLKRIKNDVAIFWEERWGTLEPPDSLTIFTPETQKPPNPLNPNLPKSTPEPLRFWNFLGSLNP